MQPSKSICLHNMNKGKMLQVPPHFVFQLLFIMMTMVLIAIVAAIDTVATTSTVKHKHIPNDSIFSTKNTAVHRRHLQIKDFIPPSTTTTRNDNDQHYQTQNQRSLKKQQRLGKSKSNNKVNTKRRNKNENDETTARIIVQYKNKETYHSILKLSKRIYHDFDNDMVLSIEVNQMGLTQLERLWSTNNYTNIVSIEMDSIWIEQGIVQNTFPVHEFDTYLLSHPQYFRTVYNHQNTTTVSNYDNDNNDNVNRTISTEYQITTEKNDSKHNSTQNRRKLNDGDSIQEYEQVPYGISMTQADQITYGSSSYPTVCIVDTGVLASHPDFDQSLVSGVSRTSNKYGTLVWNDDQRGHGTHIAGIVSARMNNQYGVRGMGTIPVYITRGLSNQGDSRESDVIEAIEQCEQQANVKIISLSLSGESMSIPMKNVLDRLYDKNILIVAAAGNDGIYKETFPSSYNKVISVGAVTETEERWSNSNYGPWIEVVAPGSMILSLGLFSTNTNQYTFALYSGTSMATPHVASAAALLWSHYPDCTNTQIRYVLAYTAKKRGGNTSSRIGSCSDEYGYGLVQVKDAYDFLKVYKCRSGNTQWGQFVGDGKCTAIDADLSSTIIVPLSLSSSP